MKKIYFYEGKYYMFSNWSPHKIKIWSKLFMTAEHAYHYKKFDTTAPKIALDIFNAQSPNEAKDIANLNKSVADPNWDLKKVKVLKQILKAKINQHKDVYEALIQSGKAEIFEDSPYDSFWGIGPDGKGQNMLGKLWMELRDGIQAKVM